jgi:hypothetical protein
MPSFERINTNHALVKDIIVKHCKSIQYRVKDEEHMLVGYIGDDLFYPCLSEELQSQGDQLLPLYPVRVNPLKLNKALLAY